MLSKQLLVTVLLISSVTLSSCNQTDKVAEEKTESIEQTVTETIVEAEKSKILSAIDIANKYIITDTHIDVPYRLDEHYEDVSEATEKGDFDYPRALAGGLNAPFMSIYIPAALEETGGSKELADKLIDLVEDIVKKSPQKFALAHNVAEMETNFNKGIISLPMGMENGSAIEGKLENLEHFYKRGIRYITLAHSKANHISDSSYDPERPAKGLTEFGKNLVVAMNEIGVMVDVSHISDDAFFQVIEISKAPVIASHSSARHFTPGFERNMSDEMIQLLAKNDGVIQINFGSTFISQKSQDNYNTFKAARDEFMQQNNVSQDDLLVTEFTKKYRQKIPFEYASLNDVLDHFDHVVKLVGVEHVGIGSDYDGVGDSLPISLKDVSSYPKLIQGFLDRGYTEEDIAKILSGNLIRVWKKVEEVAQK